VPIREELRTEAIKYIHAHLIDEAVIRDGFRFIDNVELVELIVLELKSARYIFRLMEMLDLKDNFSHPFCKFQIVQYAGVLEAAVDHLLFDRKFRNPKFEKKVASCRMELETQISLVKVPGFSSSTEVKFGGREAFLAAWKNSRKERVNINFDDRLKACVDLSLIDQRLSDEISVFYKKRHSVHLSAKLKHDISIEVGDTKRAFRRINAFCENVKRGFSKHGEPL
jgi:hypothetical protein